MQFLLGKNKTGKHLNYIMENKAGDTRKVLAAFSYINHVGGSELFEWCKTNDIPLTIYGAAQKDAIASGVLMQFVAGGYGPKAQFRLLSNNLHAKIIVFRGAGVLLGSANLTENGLWSNVETGIWLDWDDLTENMKTGLNVFFLTLEAKHRYPRNGEKQQKFIDNELGQKNDSAPSQEIS